LEIKIDLDKIRNDVKLFVATPMYGGQCTGLYAKSCLDLQNIFTRYNIELKFSFLFNESLIQRARNYLTDEFVSRTDSTHLMFIDADIHFDAKDILAMLALDVPVVAGTYPKKTLNWKNIKAAILKNPDIEENQLEQLVGEFVFNVKRGTKQFNTTELVEVSEVGTGFLMIKREVFEKMHEVYWDILSYFPDHQTQNFDGSRKIMEYFPVMVDKPDSILGGDSLRLLSEDYTWSRLVSKLGIPLYIAPFLKLGHCGTYEFKGNLQAIAQTTGKL
jgi:hypothetical protein